VPISWAYEENSRVLRKMNIKFLSANTLPWVARIKRLVGLEDLSGQEGDRHGIQ
jgi:hypothetical protein